MPQGQNHRSRPIVLRLKSPNSRRGSHTADHFSSENKAAALLQLVTRSWFAFPGIPGCGNTGTEEDPAVGAALRLKEICLVVVPRATTCTMQKVGHSCHWTGVQAASTAYHINYAEKERIWIDVTLIREGGRVRRSGREGSFEALSLHRAFSSYL
jgi:hypothetical protein